MADKSAQKEKNTAAMSSLAAAAGLTVLKLTVGLLTNSLGILAEAAHSALDLVAAGMTFFAVRWAGQPPDQEHPFGHGKMENISALFETALLALTAIWVLSEAIRRLFSENVQVEVNVWSYLVVLTAIVVDYTRSRILMRAAKKHNSQALEADALHFSTDIWSSSVVFVGLFGVMLAGKVPALAWMVHADAIAAIVVAFIVLYVSFRLGKRTIDALLDRAPEGVARQIAELVDALPGVDDCHAVRVRPSGPTWFVDMHVTMDGGMSLLESHARTETIESLVREILPDADVTVHVEPRETGTTQPD